MCTNCHLQKIEITKSLQRAISGKMLFCFMACSVTILGLSLSAYSTFKSNTTFIYTVQNWANDVIIDVQQINIDQQCPSGTEQATSFNFPGIITGCDCSQNVFAQSSLADKSCKAEQNCTKITKQQENKEFSNWGSLLQSNQTNFFKLCLKRLQGYNFITKAPQKINQCTLSDEKICGGVLLENQICVPNSERCPIMLILQNNSQSQSTNSTNNQSNTSAFNILDSGDAIGDTGLISYRSVSNTSPLSETVIQDSYGVGPNPAQLVIPTYMTEYSLFKYKRYKCKNYDKKWTPINTLTYNSFFTANKLNENYPGLTGEKFSLFQRGYVPWKQECREGQDFVDFTEKVRDIIFLINLHTTIISVAIVNVCFHFICGLIWLFDCCPKYGCKWKYCRLYCFNWFTNCWKKSSKEESFMDYFQLYNPYYAIIITLIHITYFTLFIIAIVIISKSLKIGSYVSELITKKNCSDSMTQEALAEFENQFNGQIKLNDLILFLIVLIIFIIENIIFFFFWIKITQRKRKSYKMNMYKNTEPISSCSDLEPSNQSQIQLSDRSTILQKKLNTSNMKQLENLQSPDKQKTQKILQVPNSVYQ